MNYALFFVIGLAAGVLAGMFGIGGGILIVPALILLAKFTPQVATGTSLAIFLFPVGMFGAWSYHKEGNVRVIRHRAIERLRTCMTSREGVSNASSDLPPESRATIGGISTSKVPPMHSR